MVYPFVKRLSPINNIFCSSPSAKEFESLLNAQLSKIKIEEGKIIDGVVTKVTDKFVFLFVEGLKSEPIVDINDLKSINLLEKAKIGSNQGSVNPLGNVF